MASFASVEQAAASLVDFSQPMDVSVLERIVETADQVSTGGRSDAAGSIPPLPIVAPSWASADPPLTQFRSHNYPKPL